MPSVAVERLPVEMLGLGLLGFDHLQIVFQTEGRPSSQDDWFVIEGLRDIDGRQIRLAVEGWDGGTTLSDANGGRTGEALTAKIGTRDSRGAREIAAGASAVELWATLVSHAADIERQRFPYIALALPGSPLPTINSSSLVASLLHHAGIGIAAVLPSRLRFSPGMTTLLGTSRDDTLTTGNGFSTLMGGRGRDTLRGSDSADKLYGGADDDTFRWTRGSDVVHGGQPDLGYADDGFDAIDYTGAGHVHLEAAPAEEAHRQPDFIATYAGGQDLLFSIEEISWDGHGDRVSIGKGVGLTTPLPPRLVFGGGRNGAEGANIVDLAQAEAGFDIVLGDIDNGRLRPAALRSRLSVTGADVIVASPQADRFIVAPRASPLILEDASPDDRIVLSWRPARIEADFDSQRPQDLVVRAFAGNDDITTIRVRDFHDGDLGLSPSALGGLDYLDNIPIEISLSDATGAG